MTQPDHVRYRILPEPGAHPRLGRHVNHDPRSRRYPARLTATTLGPVLHERHVPIFDQGQLGSCTGNAALGILATGPYWDSFSDSEHRSGPLSPTTRVAWDEDGAIRLYSAITQADDFDGDYPPDDTGSDGLTAAKVLTANGFVSGYEHTFSLNDALAALQHGPLMVGTVWTNSMFEPDTSGRISAVGRVAGGHEWIVDEYVPAGRPASSGQVLHSRTDYIGGTTSWGESFGVAGRFYLSVPSFSGLLAADGDVIVLTSRTAPAPEPVPAPVADVDRDLSVAMHAWLTAKGL